MSQSNSTPLNLTKLLQYSPNELSSGVLISKWIRSTTISTTFEFDLSQIDVEAKDSVTKYLNWVCLNAKVFNNFGILLNSSQINSFIEGKSTEIYIILKQLHDKIREKVQRRPSVKSTTSDPSPSVSNDTPIKLKPLAAKSATNTTNFPKLSLAISPTLSQDRQIETIRDRSSTYSNKSVQQKKEPTVDTLSLLSPDLRDVISTQNTNDTKISAPIFRNESIQIQKITNPINVFQQFDDYIIYDEIKLYGDKINDFLNEKEKLENKLNDAMYSYQSNNVSYLNNIVEQYKAQKLKLCQNITDQNEQKNFLKKLQTDLEILDDSLKKQFEESRKTLHNQLNTIHHKRLKEFAMKLNQQSETTNDKNNVNNDANNDINNNTNNNGNKNELKTNESTNNENIENIDTNCELNATLKHISSLLEKCWQNEMNKQQKQKCDKEQEIGTLKEILSIYQNLSKLIQLQSKTLKTTITDFQNLYIENDRQYNEITQTTNTSPDKTKVYFTQLPTNGYPSNTQIQLLTSCDHTTPNHLPIGTIGSTKNTTGRKKRRKSFGKKSSKNNACKTPAFSFADAKYNRPTASSQNKKVTSKRKRKKSKSK